MRQYGLLTTKFHDFVTLGGTLTFIICATWNLLVFLFVGLFALFTITRIVIDWRATWQNFLPSPKLFGVRERALTSYWLRKKRNSLVILLAMQTMWMGKIASKHWCVLKNAYKMFLYPRMTVMTNITNMPFSCTCLPCSLCSVI